MTRKALYGICASATKVLAGSSQSWIFSSFVCPARLAEAAEKYGAAPASPAPALQTSQLPRAVQGPQNSLVRQCFSRQPSASPGSHVGPPPQAKRRLPRPRLIHRRDGGPRGPHQVGTRKATRKATRLKSRQPNPHPRRPRRTSSVTCST